MNNDEEKVLNEEERQDYNDLLFQYHKAMDKIGELQDIIQALLYALRKTNAERLVNENESQHYQEKYARANNEANKLFEIVDKLDAPIAGPGYEKKY